MLLLPKDREYQKLKTKCLLGIKALQNFLMSYNSLKRFEIILPSSDLVLLESLYQNAVIRYGKPFTEMRFDGASHKYSIQNLKKESGFEVKIHQELLNLRNTLIAHDDFNQIKPRILHINLVHKATEHKICTETIISNKSLAYLTDLEKLNKINSHLEVTCNNVLKVLYSDLDIFRDFCIENPEIEQKDIKYNKNYGDLNIGTEEVTLNVPNALVDEYLNVLEPEIFKTEEGYLYVSLRVKKSHLKNEKIKLPDGNFLNISPNMENPKG